MKISRFLLLVILIISLMMFSFAFASDFREGNYKENVVEAFSFFQTNIGDQQPSQIKKVYSLGWFEYVFEFADHSEAYHIYKESADQNWEYAILNNFSGKIWEGSNLKIFSEWSSDDVSWLIDLLSNSESESIPEEEALSEYTILQKGSKGDEVKRLQERLNELGYSVGTADGDFGNKTKAAIEQFQADNGLEVTGIADEKTQEALYSDAANTKAGTTGSDNSASNSDQVKAVASGIDYTTDYALKNAPPVFSAFGSTESCKVTEVYCKEEGDDVYHFTAKVRSGSSSIGFGIDLKIINNNGKWDINEVSSLTMYMADGLNNIPGELVWSSSDSGYDALLEAFKAADVNGDGHLTKDEIFK